MKNIKEVKTEAQKAYNKKIDLVASAMKKLDKAVRDLHSTNTDVEIKWGHVIDLTRLHITLEKINISLQLIKINQGASK